MPQHTIHLIGNVPGAAQLRHLLAEFAKKGAGTVTAFSDQALRVCKSLVPADALEFEPFGTVAGRFLSLAGGRAMPLAQGGHTRAAIEAACLSLPESSPFYASARFAGTHKRIGAALDELRDWRIDAEHLETISQSASPALQEKLRSLAFVQRDVTETLARIGRHRNADRLEEALMLEASLTTAPPLFIMADVLEAPLHLAWLKWAAGSGADITVVVTAPNEGSALFKNVARAAEALDSKMTRAGTPNELVANLFQGEVASGTPLDVHVVSAADPLAEAEWALRSILAELADGGEPSRVAIYSRDTEGYVPLLEAAALRLQVPISSGRRISLVSNSFTRLTLEILEFCAGDDVRRLSSIVRSSYLSVSQEDREKLTDAVKLCFRQGELQWQALEQFALENDELFTWLPPLLEWRSICRKDAAPIKDWLDRLQEFGQQPWHEEALRGTSETNVRDGYAQSAIQRTLAQYASIHRVRGDRPFNLKQFVRLCRQLWEDSEVTTPSVDNGVQVVSSTAGIGDVDSLYVLGMLEGVFPRRRSEDPVLTDDERQEISSLLELQPPLKNSHDKAFSEREEFYRLCGAAGKKLVLSYPQTEDDRDNVRAFYLAEVERAMQGRIKAEDYPRTTFVPEDPIAETDARLAEALEGPRDKPLPNELTTGEAKVAVASGAQDGVFPRELRDVLQCPFRYLAHHNLGVRPNRRRSRWFHIYRLPAKSGLAKVPFREAAQAELEKRLEQELDLLYADAPPHDLSLIRSGGGRMIEEWLEREFAARELWPRDEFYEEAGFDGEGMRKDFPFAGSTVRLKGRFPALSQRNGYKVLHLFRASEPWSDQQVRTDNPWERLEEGDAFELGLYLAALYSRGGNVGIEIDSASGTRNLFLLPRPQEQMRSDAARGFKVTAIDRDYQNELFRKVKENANSALVRIQEAQVGAEPGDYCYTCEYGELCRRSKEFGEEEESPFGFD
jgi:hypothetical protein